MGTEPARSLGRSRPSPYGLALVGFVALQPFVSFLDGNRGQVTQLGRMLLYGAVTLAVSIAGLALAVRWSRSGDADRMAVVVAAVVAAFFNFSLLFDTDPVDGRHSIGVVLVWLVLAILLARLAHLVGGNAEVRLGLLIFASILVALPAVSYVGYRLSREPVEPVAEPTEVAIPRERPNVYWMLLDGHSRPDVLERVLGVDVAPFVDALEDRGFQVSSSSRTSYARTHLSVSSTLEMEYVIEPGDDAVRDEIAHFAPVVVGNNATSARFHALGYDTAYGEAGGVEWATCRQSLVDVCLPIHRPSPATGELEEALLDRTPLGLVPLPMPYGDPLTLEAGVVDADLGVDEPFFAFQHLLTPHYPYRYREDCTPRDRPVDVKTTTDEERLGYYATQVRCIDALVIEAVDRIVERDPTAIVIVQSDHGSDYTISPRQGPDDWTRDQLTERYGVFNAMRLPAACPTRIEGEPLVNTFRIVFACIEGTEPALLDSREFLVSIDDPTDITEIAPERFGDGP